MERNICTLNDRVYYMLSRNFLRHDFLESFLVIFGKNKYVNLRRYWKIFCTKTDYSLKKAVKIDVLSTIAVKLWENIFNKNYK